MKSIIKNADKGLFGAGWALLIVGTLVRIFDRDQNALGFASGLGCGFILVGTISMLIKYRNPKYKRQEEIAQKDERNILIRIKAGYMSCLVTTLSLITLEIVFLIVDNWFACLLTICALAIHMIAFLVALYYYNKRL
jgi:hypothetical protein